MDLQITQQNLDKALTTVSRTANTRSTLPILNNILLTTTNNRLRLSVTNLDIAVTEYVGVKIAKEGTLTVPARLFQDFVSNLPSGTVRLKQNNNKLEITTENNQSTLNGISAEEFPVMPKIEDGNVWAIGSAELKEALQQVAFAASKDDTRPILTGVLIKSQNDKLLVAATDSYRLAEKTIKLKQKPNQFLIPANAAQELLRIINDQGEIEVTNNDQQVRFKTNTTELIARIIEGEYPDYQKLIPQKFSSTALMSKNDLVNITKISSLFARESAGSITIKLDKNDKKVSIQSVSSQVGENCSSADAEVEQDGEITLNSNYLLEALQAIKSDKISISFNGKLDPLVVKNPDQSDYLHIVMPLNS